VKSVSTDRPAWLTIPLSEIQLPQSTSREGLLPGVDTTKDIELFYTCLKKFSESDELVSQFAVDLGRALQLTRTKLGDEAVIVSLARSLLQICGFSRSGWFITGTDDSRSRFDIELYFGTEVFKLTSIPDLVLWKNFWTDNMEPIGSVLCEAKKSPTGFSWPHILGELLALGAYRDANGFHNANGSVDIYSVISFFFNKECALSIFARFFFEHIAT